MSTSTRQATFSDVRDLVYTFETTPRLLEGILDCGMGPGEAPYYLCNTRLYCESRPVAYTELVSLFC